MASDPRDYRIEISGLKEPGSRNSSKHSSAQGRPFLSVHFACCGVYCRIYRNNDATAYVGNCPRCGKPVRFLIGEGGTDQRFFTVE